MYDINVYKFNKIIKFLTVFIFDNKSPCLYNELRGMVYKLICGGGDGNEQE